MSSNGEEIRINYVPRNEVVDLVSKPPSWLLRSGLSMIALVFSAVFTVVSFIEYPDKIIGQGYLTSESPPIKLVSRSNGYIDDILIKDGQEVSKDETLLYLSNSTDPKEIAAFNRWIEQYQKIRNPKYYLQLKFPEGLKLGILQREYAALHLKYDELKQTLRNGNVFSRINNISEEISKIKILNNSLHKEKEIYSAELKLEKKDFDRSLLLEKEGILSTQELEKSNATYLQKQRQYESYENNQIQNNIKVDQLKLEQLELQGNRVDLIKQYQFSINEIIARFMSLEEEWSDKYEIKSLIDGNITLSSKINLHAAVQPDQVLGYIIPNESQGSYVSCKIPIGKSGKIEVNQKALLKLDAFPYKEYGMVLAEVSGMSAIPAENDQGEKHYEIKIKLPEKIKTDLGKAIPYKPEMTMQVEIITEDKSLLDRIFNQFISLIRKTDL